MQTRYASCKLEHLAIAAPLFGGLPCSQLLPRSWTPVSGAVGSSCGGWRALQPPCVPLQHMPCVS
eukprot:12298388-Alexandrium_andersonii.AAC.1